MIELASEKSGEGKGFWSAKRIITLFLIVLGMFFGMLAQHYYIEPLLSDDYVGGLQVCMAQVQVLDEENSAFALQAHDLNLLLTFCNSDLKRCQNIE